MSVLAFRYDADRKCHEIGHLQLLLRGYVFARTDRTEDARAMWRALDRAAAQHPVIPMQYALIHVGLGEHDQALGLLESGLDRPSTEMRLLRVEPLFGPLRDYPAFQRLLERIGLGD